MSNLGTIIGLPIGLLGFLFLFWRRLKEDYPAGHILSFGFLIIIPLLIGFLAGLVISGVIFSPNPVFFSPTGLWFWLAFGLSLIGFGVGQVKFRLRTYETFEAMALGFLFWFFALSFSNSLVTGNLKLFFFSLVVGSLVSFFFFLDVRYKTFTWYKSGKIGFSGLAILVMLFFIRVFVALLDPSMLSFIGKFDAILSGIVSFIFLIIIYNLSG